MINNEEKLYYLVCNQHDCKPYYIAIDTNRGFIQQVSPNYVTRNGAKRWAIRHGYDYIELQQNQKAK